MVCDLLGKITLPMDVLMVILSYEEVFDDV